MPKQPRSPFDVKITPEAKTKLAIWLADELDKAINIRTHADQENA